MDLRGEDLCALHRQALVVLVNTNVAAPGKDKEQDQDLAHLNVIVEDDEAPVNHRKIALKLHRLPELGNEPVANKKQAQITAVMQIAFP